MATIKTDKVIDKLEQLCDKIESRIDELECKMADLEERAGDEDRDLTTREMNLFEKYENDILDLQAEQGDIENAIDYLREWQF